MVVFYLHYDVIILYALFCFVCTFREVNLNAALCPVYVNLKRAHKLMTSQYKPKIYSVLEVNKQIFSRTVVGVYSPMSRRARGE